MNTEIGLHAVDWAIIGLYLALALGVGFLVKGEAEDSKESYFLAGRGLPWWWAGLSIAATTFAADTPLAITGLIAKRGISGNWMWLPWMGAHAAVVVVFAAGWNRLGVLTDAELVAVRYSGAPARALRWLRAGLSGLLLNCLILGWVLRAMAKIAAPFFHWERWLPGLVGFLEARWWESSPMGSPSEVLTVLVLLGIVAIYSSLGGIRGVVLTDLLQLAVALVGSTWMAFSAWQAVGGRAGLVGGLERLYGPEHTYLDLFPDPSAGWVADVAAKSTSYVATFPEWLADGLTAFHLVPLMLGLYFVVQSYANVSPDGGGYMMQRLNTTPDRRQARGAALVFMLVHYLLRIWPWFLVALVALVLIPKGQEATALNGAAALVGADRELAYPVLMRELLVPGLLGLMVTSMLAAFMSTVDTHLNWGASYLVNDVFLVLKPDAETRSQIRVARGAVFFFVGAAVFISFRITHLAEAWGWVACLGASLATPSLLRWFWWRVNATAEMVALVLGLSLGGYLILYTEVPYEIRLVLIFFASLTGTVLGVLLGPPTDPEQIQEFMERARPIGFWPGRSTGEALRQLGLRGLRWAVLVAGVILLLAAGHRALLLGAYGKASLMTVIGAAAMLGGGLYDFDEEPDEPVTSRDEADADTAQ